MHETTWIWSNRRKSDPWFDVVKYKTKWGTDIERLSVLLANFEESTWYPQKCPSMQSFYATLLLAWTSNWTSSRDVGQCELWGVCCVYKFIVFSTFNDSEGSVYIIYMEHVSLDPYATWKCGIMFIAYIIIITEGRHMLHAAWCHVYIMSYRLAMYILWKRRMTHMGQFPGTW